MENTCRPGSVNSNDTIHISECLVPAREFKQAGQRRVSFGGLLERPLILKEDLKQGCGGQLWPAGMVLANLELGAGGGLVGLAVASGCELAPSAVYITDQAPMLPLMETNIKLNHLSTTVNTAILDWGTPALDGIPQHPDVILAADCVYFEPAFPLLISTLNDLLGPDSVCYFCFKRRRRADLRFLKLAKKAFQVTEINDDPDTETYKRENIYLYCIRLKPGANGGKDSILLENQG